MGWKKKTLLILGIPFLFYTTSWDILHYTQKKQSQKYVETHLLEVMKNQEEKLSISHKGIPQIKYSLPKNIVFSKEISGCYIPKTDAIHFDLNQ